MSPHDKPLVWLRGEVTSPPFGDDARREAGYLLRKLQQGETLTMPHSRSMPSIGKRCHELRVVDGDVTWRIVYRTDHDAVVLLDIFKKKTESTPKRVITACKKRLKSYDAT